MKLNQLKIGSLLSYLQMGLGVIVGICYTPVMIRLLGPSEYGLYNTVSSTIAMMSVLSLGFNSSYIRFYSKYKKENDRESIYKLNGLFLSIYLVIALVVLLCGIFLTANLNLVFDEGLTAAEYEIARVLMLLLTVSLAVSFPMSVFSSIISAHERFIFLKLLGIGKTVVSPLVTLPLLLLGYRSIAMVAVTVSVTLAVDLSYLVYTVFVLKQRFRLGKLESGLTRSLFSYTAFIAINMLIDQINSNLGKVVLGRYKGTEAVSVYSVGYALFHYYQMFSVSISSVFTPRIHAIVRTVGDNKIWLRKELTALFIKVGRIQFLILGLVASGVIFFGKPFIVSFWAGEGYHESYYVAVLLILSISVALIQNLGIEIQRAENKHRFRSIVYGGMALLNLGMMVVFSQMYGAIGAAIGTAVSLVVANGLVMNIYYHKRCYIDIIAFWKSIGRLSVGLLLPIGFGIALNYLLDLDRIRYLLLGIVIYTAVYCLSMWFTAMNRSEKELLLKPVRKILSVFKRRGEKV